MECSICFENITRETGKAELSCSHTFHLKCLSNWFTKNENCPYCRHEANEMEKMGHLENVDDEEDDDEDEDDTDDDTDDDSDDDSDDDIDIELHASRERARHLFRLKQWDMRKAELEAYAATRIAALVRGHQSRKYFLEMKCWKEEEIDTLKNIKKSNKDLITIKASMRFYWKVASMTRPQMNIFAATKIQSRWKAFRQQKHYSAIKGSIVKGLKIELNTDESDRVVHCQY
jgi:hypothetical protein